LAIFAALIVWPRGAMTQQDQARQKQQMPTIDEYQPKSTLVTKEHKIERAKFPFIDIHSPSLESHGGGSGPARQRDGHDQSARHGKPERRNGRRTKEDGWR